MLAPSTWGLAPALVPARRQPRQLRLHEVDFVHDHGEIVAGLGCLPEGESALGIVGKVVRVACVEVRVRLSVALACLTPDYRAPSRPHLLVANHRAGLATRRTRCRDHGPSQCLWLSGRDRDAVDLCPRETQPVVYSGIRRGLHPGLSVGVFGIIEAVWPWVPFRRYWHTRRRRTVTAHEQHSIACTLSGEA
jgi:hypothetical protein